MAAPIDGTLRAFYIPMAHQRGRNADPLIAGAIADYLTKAGIVPFHGATEYAWTTTRLGVQPRIVGDGYIAARLLQLEDKNLKDLSKSRLHRDEVIKLKDLFEPGDTSYDFSRLDPQDARVSQYVLDDALNAFDLEVALRGDLKMLGMLGLYDLELSALMFMAENEVRGYAMNNGEFIRALARERARVDQLERTIFGALGGQAFAINSPAQLGKKLKALGIQPRMTEKNNESWSKDSLKLIPNPPPVIAQIIEWKSAFSVMNALNRSPLRANDSGRVYPRWHSIGYSGHPEVRSEKPSLTNLPKAARHAFIAPAGTRWMMWGWLQPRMRALASVSRDENMKLLFKTEYDFYMTVGATLRGGDAGSGTEEDRLHAKQLLFAIVDYCGDVERVAARLGRTPDDADAEMSGIRRLFPAAMAYLDTVRIDAPCEVSSFMGRRWQLPSDVEYLPSDAIYAILNHTVATWMKITLGRLMGQYELQHPRMAGFSQWTPVYDKLYYLLNADISVPAHLAYIQPIVETPVFGVKLRAEYGTGTSWGDVQVFNQMAFAQQMADFLAQQNG